MGNTEAKEQFSATMVARATLATAAVGSLATLTPDGSPFASFVLVGTDDSGDIVLLLSQLAVHTRNLAGDPRASLLVVAEGGESGDPLAGARVTLSGRVDTQVGEDGQKRFLAGHPEAERYVAFGDFRFYRLKIASAHLVAGFGRIVDLARADIVSVGR
jgi:putative heme iron utilization protein